MHRFVLLIFLRYYLFVAIGTNEMALGLESSECNSYSNEIQKRSINLPQPPFCGLMLTDRVYGGNKTQLDEHPWMALLIFNTPQGRGYYCGGSLINENWVLTAAHCITGRALQPGWSVIGVRLGEWNTDHDPDCTVDDFGQQDCAPAHIDIPVDLQISHPHFDSYKSDVPNDIALLRLQQRVVFTPFVKPVCLALETTMRMQSFVGAKAIVSGWGRTERRDRASNIKLKAVLRVWNTQNCITHYSRSYNITLNSNQICAGGVVGVDACRGDSGGPLILELLANGYEAYYQIGVVSFGKIRCGDSDTPGIYTRVGPYIEWIGETIAANGIDEPQLINKAAASSSIFIYIIISIVCNLLL